MNESLWRCDVETVHENHRRRVTDTEGLPQVLLTGRHLDHFVLTKYRQTTELHSTAAALSQPVSETIRVSRPTLGHIFLSRSGHLPLGPHPNLNPNQRW